MLSKIGLIGGGYIGGVPTQEIARNIAELLEQAESEERSAA